MRRYTAYRVFTSLIILSFTSLHVSAETKNDNFSELLNMSLNELLNVRVSVASLKSEQVIKSPAIVSTFMREDMEALGLRKLGDFLSFFPGIIVNEQLVGHAAVQIRGLTDTSNQKILFLIDETPYWLASEGNVPLLGIPASLIEKVEVIRGPGSVIYGTNATAGVIKVVTRKSNSQDISLEAGENDTVNLHGFNGQDKYQLAFQAMDSDGYNATVKNSIADDMGSIENTNLQKLEKTKSVYARYHTENISAFLTGFESEKSGGFFGSARPFTLYREKSILANTTYNRTYGSQTVNLAVDFNYYTIEKPVEDIFGLFGLAGNGSVEFADDEENYRWRVNARVSTQLSDNHALIYGFESERRSTSASLIKDDADGANLMLLPPIFTIDPEYNALLIYDEDDVTEQSVYVQSDMELRKIRFLAGLRYTENSGSGHKYIPRIAAVYNIDERQSVKALYSVGYNSPTFRQQSQVGAFGSTRPDSLEAEIIRSYDLAYLFYGKNDFFVANLFYIQSRNIIENRSGVFENSGDFDRAGYELDYQHIIQKSQQVFGNLSYLHQGDKQKNNDQSSVYAPKYTASFGYKQLIAQRHCVGTSVQYVGERKNVDSYILANISYIYERTQYRVFVLLDNILDEDIEHPDIRTIGTSDTVVQARDGRSVMLGYRHMF